MLYQGLEKFKAFNSSCNESTIEKNIAKSSRLDFKVTKCQTIPSCNLPQPFPTKPPRANMLTIPHETEIPAYFAMLNTTIFVITILVTWTVPVLGIFPGRVLHTIQAQTVKVLEGILAKFLDSLIPGNGASARRGAFAIAWLHIWLSNVSLVK